jgi:RNA polymerase sigma factor (sigma-70 family)
VAKRAHVSGFPAKWLRWRTGIPPQDGPQRKPICCDGLPPAGYEGLQLDVDFPGGGSLRGCQTAILRRIQAQVIPSSRPTKSASANAGSGDPSESMMTATLSYITDGQASEAAAAEQESAASVAHGWVQKLMHKERRGIVRMLWRLLGQEADVMDAFQDCFCKVATTVQEGNVRSAKAYVYRTAANIAIEMLRKRKCRQAHWPAVAAARATQSTRSGEPSSLSDRHENLRGAIEALPSHLRNVIVLRDLGDKSYKEVGQILRIDPATARVYRRHAVVRLSELLGKGDPS